MPDMIRHPATRACAVRRVFRDQGLDRTGPRIKSGV